MNYREKDFEDHIEAHLLDSGYRKAVSEAYDRSTCLLPDDVIGFLKDTQAAEFRKLGGSPDASQRVLKRLVDQIERKGSLHVFRKGIQVDGCDFQFAAFQPRSGLNPQHEQQYRQNRFTVVRQLFFSTATNKSVDVVLFLNGIPIVTLELKSSLTGQTVDNGIDQYKDDRSPKEPLFRFKRCLVHFAVGSEKVYMTTRLEADATRFFPFNLDTENPVNPTGHRSAYLWEKVLQPDSVLDLIDNYLHLQDTSRRNVARTKNGFKNRKEEVLVFPRYHQLDCVRKILRTVRMEGVGKSYLVQHSAGSGKSNSIAWLAHQLASLFQSNTDSTRLFDSIIVVTDRKVLDRQLQETIKQFEQVEGMVRKIDANSQQLKAALEAGKDIIVTTLQKFPVISETMETLKGKRFAVIVDEAHSSQSGEGAKHLKKVLSAGLENAEAEDAVEGFDVEDELVQEVRTRGKQPHISYFAFTATPKNKTLELFGRKNASGVFEPFHTYTMRQAIEEGYILDVLQHYTTFKRYFHLQKAFTEDKEVDKKKTIRLLTSYVDLHTHAIELKVGIMLDHFQDVTQHTIQGEGRAMVVTRSRLHAVRFYQEFSRQMHHRGLLFHPLVAFSGTVKDPDSGEEYTENSLNLLKSGVDIREAFRLPQYRILVVANKYQTGFDEPLLHTMYVDKKLRDVQAVQTLSRLNRSLKGKTDTVILDFVNAADEIQDAFQPYYLTTLLDEETDPNRLYDLKTEVEEFGLFSAAEVDQFIAIYLNPKVRDEAYQPILDTVIDRWRNHDDDQREGFRTVIRKYVRLYGYVAQLVPFVDVKLEKLYQFLRHLARKLPWRRTDMPYEVLAAIDLESIRVQETYKGLIGQQVDPSLGLIPGIGLGTGSSAQEEEKDLLSNILKVINEQHGYNLTEDQQMDLGRMWEKVLVNERLREVAAADNTPDSIRRTFERMLDTMILDFVNDRVELYKILQKKDVNDTLKREWFREYMGRAGR